MLLFLLTRTHHLGSLCAPIKADVQAQKYVYRQNLLVLLHDLYVFNCQPDRNINWKILFWPCSLGQVTYMGIDQLFHVYFHNLEKEHCLLLFHWTATVVWRKLWIPSSLHRVNLELHGEDPSLFFRHIHPLQPNSLLPVA